MLGVLGFRVCASFFFSGFFAFAELHGASGFRGSGFRILRLLLGFNRYWCFGFSVVMDPKPFDCGSRIRKADDYENESRLLRVPLVRIPTTSSS